ncbi:olfactory receptor 1020-like [Spea bombifrons]|uniref:olfactory receptor 1020-like n=1 Tax=Spea bombifrons TaxID=233779 RepID=UPI00234904E5|nr:olfactory receptor 1020-like [Spea bombifrons]
MIKENETILTEFILVGLSADPRLQFVLFPLFLCIYVVTVLVNASVIFVYKFSPSLHTPMYFYLANFSFLEICYVSSTVPKMLANLLADRKTISFYGCAVQMYWFLLLGGTECYMLAAMAYDRYHAICHPLSYAVFMNNRVCTQLILGSWLVGAVNSLVHTLLTFKLKFCCNKINHFFCDIPPLLKLACMDTRVNEMVVFIVSGCVIVGSFILTMTSYKQIISTILKIRSRCGRKKAISTCTSHFMVVTLFYGSGIFMYFRPKSSYSMDQDRIIAVMYSVIAPMLNPFIYSLRNGEMKTAVKKLTRKLASTEEL